MEKSSTKTKKMLSSLTNSITSGLIVLILFSFTPFLSHSLKAQTANFDLAIKKTTLTKSVVAGGKVTFQLEVFNQGNVKATKVNLVDYIPSGLVLSDGNWQVADGKAKLLSSIEEIAPGNSVIRTITFNISVNAASKIVNSAEIFEAKDSLGVIAGDSDSLLDDDNTNDGTPIDNEITQQGSEGGDEDDHDIEEITVSKPGFISGFLWEDKNKNGLKDADEPGVGSISLFLTVKPTNDTLFITTTSAEGHYNFEGLPSGTFNLETLTDYNVLEGGNFSPQTGKTADLIITNGDSLLNINGALTAIETSCEDSLLTRLPTRPICADEEFEVNVEFLSGGDVLWFNSPTGGDTLKITPHGNKTILKLNSSSQFYLQSSKQGADCHVNRVALSFFVNPKPATPVVATIAEICSDSLINLNNLLSSAPSSADNTFAFYTDSARNNRVDSLAGAGQYYVFQESIFGCISQVRPFNVKHKTCDSTSFVDLSLIKVANRRTVFIDEEIEYTISLRNSGSKIATNIEIEDKLPESLSFVSSSDFSHNTGLLRLKVDSLSSNSTKDFKYKAKPKELGYIVNFVEIIKADQPDPNSTPGNGVDKNEDDDDDEAIMVISKDSVNNADLSLVKSVDKGVVKIGDNVTYTIKVTNTGPFAATHVVVRDSLVKGLTFIRTQGGEDFEITGNKILAKFDSVGVNTTKEFKVEARVDSLGTILNRAEITASDQPDPDSTPNAGANEDDDDTVTVTSVQDCSMTAPFISSNRNYICSGDEITLTAIGCTNVVWSTGQLGASIKVRPVSNTTYSAFCQSGNCKGPASNNLLISISSDAKPTVTATKQAICFGESVILTVTGCSDDVKWSSGETESSISVSPAVTSQYTATCIGGGCAGNISNPVKIEVSNSRPAAPTAITFIQNVCPVPFVDLNDAILTKPAGTTIVFKEGITPSSPGVDSLIYTKGLFYAYSKYTNGCLSEPVGITVDVLPCGKDGTADLALSVQVDETNIQVGDTVKLTVIVKNYGPENVRDARVISNIPTGLGLINYQDSLLVTGSTMTFLVDSLGAGKSDTLLLTAKFSEAGTLIYKFEIKSLSIPDSTPLNNKSELTLNVRAGSAGEDYCLGLALAATKKEWQANGTVNITYTAIIANCGQKELKNISLCDEITKGLSDSAVVTMVTKPVVNTGSHLFINPDFTGVSTSSCIFRPELSYLDSAAVDTVTYTLNVKPHGKAYIKSLNISGFGADSTTAITDVSNDGLNPSKVGSVPTIVVLDSNFVSNFVGLAKELVNVKRITPEGDSFDLEFKFTVKNYSDKEITNLQIEDDLSSVFEEYATVDTVYINNLPNDWTANNKFTGLSDQIKLLEDSTSSLSALNVNSLNFVVRITLKSKDKLTFENFGLVIGRLIDEETTLDDVSTNGNNPDFNGSGNPKDDSIPTVVDLRSFYEQSVFTPIGIAKAGHAELSSSGGTQITYTVVVKNYGDDTLKNVQLLDDLNKVFDIRTQFVVLTTPSVKAGSLLVPNQEYNGTTKTDLLLAGSSLIAGKQDTVTFIVSVFNTNEESKTYKNQVQGIALFEGNEVKDLSVSGDNPDADENGNPGNDSGFTINIVDPGGSDSTLVGLVVSEGISPNDDGLNDVFTIKDENGGVNLENLGTIKLEIFNRWGHPVYRSLDYVKDFRDGKGWSGSSNMNLVIGKGSSLPDGTYFYALSSTDASVFGGKKKVGSVTLKK